MMASANSRVEAKVFSLMNGVSSPKKQSGVIVRNNMDVEIGRALLIDQFEKGEPLLMTVARPRWLINLQSR
jgi:hypothetical protein